MSNVLKTMEIVTGYDFGYFSHKSFKIKCIVRSIYFLRGVIIFAVGCFSNANSSPGILFFVIINLVFNCICILGFMFLRSDCTAFKIECKIREIDRSLNCKTCSFLEKRIVLSMFLCYLFWISMSVVYYLNSGPPLTSFIDKLSTLMLFTNLLNFDTLMILLTYIFYCIYHRFVIFEAKIRANCYNDLVHYHCLYKSLADLAEKYKNSYEHLVSLITYRTAGPNRIPAMVVQPA